MCRRGQVVVFDLAATVLAYLLAGCDSSGYLPGIISGGGGAAEVIGSSFLGPVISWLF